MSTIPIPRAGSKERITIFETTLRSGDQSPGYALTAREKLKMAHALAAMGVDVIEAGFAASSDLDFCAIKTIAQEIRGAKIAVLARAKKRDIEFAAAALEKCAHPRIHTYISVSDRHMSHKLQMTPERVLAKINESVRMAYDFMKGRGDVEWSAEDAARTSPDFLSKAVKVAIDAGATTINLPDMVGYAQPHEYEALFRNVIAGTNPAPHIVFSAHALNDLGMAVANSLAALKGGARQIECTVRGVGERAGNAQLEAVVAALDVRSDYYPFWCGIKRGMMKEVADLHRSFVPDAPSRLPVIGDNAFAHTSGVHQHGVVRDKGSYEIMDAQMYGNETTLPLSRHSGRAGVNATLKQQGIFLSEEECAKFTVEEFTPSASEALERHHTRIVPPGMAAGWARKWMATQNSPVANAAQCG